MASQLRRRHGRWQNPCSSRDLVVSLDLLLAPLGLDSSVPCTRLTYVCASRTGDSVNRRGAEDDSYVRGGVRRAWLRIMLIPWTKVASLTQTGMRSWYTVVDLSLWGGDGGCEGVECRSAGCLRYFLLRFSEPRVVATAVRHDIKSPKTRPTLNKGKHVMTALHRTEHVECVKHPLSERHLLAIRTRLRREVCSMGVELVHDATVLH